MLERIHQLIKRDNTPPASVVELLEQTFIGTKGTLYQLLDTRQKIASLHLPHFIYIERNGKAIGVAAFCERIISLNHIEAPSFYIRYFAFDKIFQGGATKRTGHSNFHHYFKALFDTSNLDPVYPTFEKRMFWAFIDPENIRSFNMNEKFGFQTIGSFNTTAFSRVNPKNRGVERVLNADQPEILNELNRFYQNFNFYSTVHLFEKDNYFILRHEGEIVCGIQANPVHWRIKSLPGLTGKFMLRFAPYIPRIRKLINPKNHQFLATEGLFWKEGCEHHIGRLLEGALALTQHHSLLIWTDDSNPMLKRLKLKWGFIQKMKVDNAIKIVAKFNHYSPEEVFQIKKQPKYLSGFDMT